MLLLQEIALLHCFLLNEPISSSRTSLDIFWHVSQCKHYLTSILLCKINQQAVCLYLCPGHQKQVIFPCLNAQPQVCPVEIHNRVNWPPTLGVRFLLSELGHH